MAALFTPAEIEAARERRAELEQKQAEREQNLKLQAERQRRIDALPGLRRKTAGAEHMFINRALEAIERVAGDANKVEWPKVESAAAREAITEHGQSPESVIRAICGLSPERTNEKGHQRVADWVADWVASVAPKYLQQYEAKKRPQRGLDR